LKQHNGWLLSDYTYNYVYTYSFFILHIEFHIVGMHTEFLPNLPVPCKRVSRPGLTKLYSLFQTSAVFRSVGT